MMEPTTAVERAHQQLTNTPQVRKDSTVSKVLDDAKAAADAASALVTEIETSEQEGTVTPVDKTITSVTVNYSDGTTDSFSNEPPLTGFPTATDTASDTVSDSGSDSSDKTPADSDSGEPAPAPEPVAAGTIPS